MFRFANFMFTLAAVLVLSVPSPSVGAGPDNPWVDRELVRFGMPFIGHAVKPQQKGLINDVLKEVYEEVDIDFEHVPVPYGRALMEVRSGELDFTLDVKDNQKGVLQGRTTLVFYDLTVAYLRPTEFKGLKSLADKRVAFLHGFDLERFLPVKVKVQRVYDLSSAFHLLDRGLVGYVLGDNELLRNAMFESGLADASFVTERVGSYKVLPIFAPTDRGRRFRKIYDERMREMMAKGDFQAIFSNHGYPIKAIARITKANGF